MFSIDTNPFIFLTQVVRRVWLPLGSHFKIYVVLKDNLPQECVYLSRNRITVTFWWQGVCITNWLRHIWSRSWKDKKIHEARAFNFIYRYINDALSINNSRFAEFVPLIYPPELEVKETTDTASSSFVRIIFGHITRIWRQWSTQY